MATLDISGLAEPIDAALPSGENLEYDPDFLELERLAQGKPEQQFGDTVVPAEEPDWRTVRTLALGLLGRTKDLRIVVHLARAAIHTDGAAGFADAIALVRLLVDQHWPTLHPELDADDDNDPTMRINALVALQDPETVLRPLREAPLVRAPRVGLVSLRDILIARGDLPPPADTEPMQQATIDAAFADAEPEVLQATAQAIRTAVGELAATEAAILDNVGSHNAPDLAPLSSMLGEMDRIFAQQLARIGGGDAGATGGEEAMFTPDGAGAATQSGGRPGEIRSRSDVIRTIDQIIAYYQAHEPSSPIPLLLRRAQRLVPMDFIALMRDLAPDGLTQIQTISGASDTEEY